MHSTQIETLKQEVDDRAGWQPVSWPACYRDDAARLAELNDLVLGADFLRAESWFNPSNPVSLWVVFTPAGFRLASDHEELACCLATGAPLPAWVAEDELEVLCEL